VVVVKVVFMVGQILQRQVEHQPVQQELLAAQVVQVDGVTTQLAVAVQQVILATVVLVARFTPVQAPLVLVEMVLVVVLAVEVAMLILAVAAVA
jgi:hypothetical protein